MPVYQRELETERQTCNDIVIGYDILYNFIVVISDKPEQQEM